MPSGFAFGLRRNFWQQIANWHAARRRSGIAGTRRQLVLCGKSRSSTKNDVAPLFPVQVSVEFCRYRDISVAVKAAAVVGKLLDWLASATDKTAAKKGIQKFSLDPFDKPPKAAKICDSPE
jgi:hypothetical protein